MTDGDRRAEADAVVGFLRGLRDGVEQGLGPLSAAQRAATEMPPAFRSALDRTAARMSGDGGEDEWGYDAEVAASLGPALDLLYDAWWRVHAVGAEHVPASGRALVVANHAGSLFPFDAAMIATAIRRHHGHARWPRFLTLEWALSLPLLGDLIGAAGGVPANPATAAALLDREELVVTFPEGVRGTGKHFSERYRLQPFGDGFVRTALRSRAPIVPVAVVGSEEIYPMLADSEALAGAIGAPYFPVTPTFPALGPLGLIPLPSRWRIELCEPIDVDEHPAEAADDPAVVGEICTAVRTLIQRKLHENLVLRGPAFASAPGGPPPA